ncbi:MAG: hypothetical protein CMN75_05615 [Spirochaeta sp.]|nr:hypothetical protein [Spirochaeta sp.]
MPLPALLSRSAVGGVLMGLANLVPGISGGTMLLAAGVYPTFIESIARVTTLRLQLRPVLTLGTIAAFALTAILLLAGTMHQLVIEERWIMYSLFIGLTLGGVPLVWRLARPATPSLVAGAVIAFGLMVWMSFGATSGGSENARFGLLFLSGLAGASAMILPGVSGGYLLLILGQYAPILKGIDNLKLGLLGSEGVSGMNLELIMASMGVVVPVGLGVLVGIVGVSNLLRWLLDRFEKWTLGLLLGLLLGSVVGLYPFQAPVAPEPGFVHQGKTLSAEELSQVDPEDWPLARFAPSGGQTGAAAALILLGLAGTLAVDRIGRSSRRSGPSPE